MMANSCKNGKFCKCEMMQVKKKNNLGKYNLNHIELARKVV